MERNETEWNQKPHLRVKPKKELYPGVVGYRHEVSLSEHVLKLQLTSIGH